MTEMILGGVSLSQEACELIGGRTVPEPVPVPASIGILPDKGR